jgi:hypothetical protein
VKDITVVVLSLSGRVDPEYPPVVYEGHLTHEEAKRVTDEQGGAYAYRSCVVCENDEDAAFYSNFSMDENPPTNDDGAVEYPSQGQLELWFFHSQSSERESATPKRPDFDIFHPNRDACVNACDYVDEAVEQANRDVQIELFGKACGWLDEAQTALEYSENSNDYDAAVAYVTALADAADLELVIDGEIPRCNIHSVKER